MTKPLSARDEARRLFREAYGDDLADFDFAAHNRCRDCGAVPDVAGMLLGDDEHGTKHDERSGGNPPECMHDLCVARRKARWLTANPPESGAGCVTTSGWAGGFRTTSTTR